jgi:hypothetical protein
MRIVEILAFCKSINYKSSACFSMQFEINLNNCESQNHAVNVNPTCKKKVTVKNI